MTFPQFFRALWDYAPFPWQELLAEKVMAGEWPPIGLPTAAGKTALIDIAVYALAKGAPGAARRIFFVVDRRVIVDEAAERAARLASKLAEAPADSELGEALAKALKDLGGDRPLATAVLRGGIPRENPWADSPLQPAVICSTVDQIGSSLLFRAYGTSEYGRSIRAGLAAQDSLILLDEAHTSHAFAETLGLVRRYRDWAEQPLESPFRVVEMSATPRADSLKETAGDRENPVLRRRWQASKRARLVLVSAEEDEEAAKGGFTALVGGLVREARALRDRHEAKVIGVIANRVKTARRVHDALATDTESDAILMTGRSRPFDRDRIWEQWKEVIGLDGKSRPEKPVFVVATQCIEVGANLDFDGLVTEIASVDALEQRFGRLDRDGKRAEAVGATHAAIVAQKDQAAKKYVDVLYGGSVAATWAWLNEHVTAETRVEILPAEGKKKPKTRKVKEEYVEMGVLRLRAALAETQDRGALTMPAQASPVLMPAHMDLLNQTSPEPVVSPEVSVYLHGPEAGPADVQVVWRADLPDDPNGWCDIVAMCPPAAAEALALPVWAIRRWLAGEDAGELADIEGAPDQAGRPKGIMPAVLEWRGVDESRPVDPSKVRAGTTIVVRAQMGGCDEWGWNPASKADVDDVGDAVKLRLGRPMLRLHEGLAERWGYESLAGQLWKAEQKNFRNILEASSVDESAPRWVKDLLDKLRRAPLKGIDHPVKGETWAAITSRAVFDQNDSRGSYGREVLLAEHLAACEQMAAGFAQSLPERLRRTVVRAAAMHDIGKADPRFQAWLRGGNPVKADELIAKSGQSAQNRAAMERARKLAGYPKGARHELMSMALLDGDDAEGLDAELLLHLVASHHGRCRPFAPCIEDREPVTVKYENRQGSSAHELERPGSGVSERFWKLTRRYGWYGLAYLEALVRLADQRQSEAEQKRPGKAAHA